MNTMAIQAVRLYLFESPIKNFIIEDNNTWNMARQQKTDTKTTTTR